MAITGTDDASVISGTVTGAVSEGDVGDAPVTATGSIAISDVDGDDSPSFADVASTAGDNGFGSFELGVGCVDVHVGPIRGAGPGCGRRRQRTPSPSPRQMARRRSSRWPSRVRDDASVISGTVTGAVNEGNVGDAPVTATGSIAISDVDGDDNPSFADVASTAGDNGFGSFELTGGTWTYTLDQSAVQDLDCR